jgi:sodium/hydrogen antiporter
VLALVVVTGILLGWALVAGRLAKWSIGAPIAMTVAGVALTAGSNPVFRIILDPRTAEHGVEIVLAILLFVDATEVPGGVLGREPRIMLRLLGLALPLALILTWATGLVLFPREDPWVLAVAATVIVPIDLAPPLAVLRDPRIPARLREILNVESGLADGLVGPVFLFCLAGAQAHDHGFTDAAVTAVPAALIALGVGAAVGLSSAWLLGRAEARGWTQPSALRLGVLALPLLAYALALVLHGNGFVAAFVAGVFFGAAARRLPPDALHLAEDAGSLLSLVVWFLFGEVVNQTAGGVGFRLVGYALLAVTVLRMVPVLVSLRHSGVQPVDRVFLGWFGSRGLTSIVFGLLAYISLPHPANEFVGDTMVVTVLVSVIVHGLTSGPMAAGYAHRTHKISPRSP